MSGAGRVRRIARLSFTAADLAATRTFYAALGFAAGPVERVAAGEIAGLGLADAGAERLPMRLGAQRIEFLRFDTPGRPYPQDGTASDLWFQHIAIVVSDPAAASAAALSAGAVPITRGGPQTLPPNTGRVSAWKFRDPDGHPLEILHFPSDRAPAEWRGHGGLFLGIDHTAIAVADPGASERFYRGLGFAARGGSHNAGPEQSRLDDLAEDRVRVLALAPPEAPPHLELLGYETGLRRPMPADTRPNDAWATRTVIEADGAEAAALLRDPDGHALLLLPPPARDRGRTAPSVDSATGRGT